MEVIVARCAALDVHKDTVTACVRIPGKADQRRQGMREFRTFSADLRRLRDWLVAQDVTQVAIEDAGIKLDSVVSDVRGKSAREMLDALITGVRDPELLAEMARTRMRPKIPELSLALEGRFTEHHALMLEMHLTHVDHLTDSIARLDTEVDEVMAPFGEQARALQTIPGVGKRTAEVIVAEIGGDYFARRTDAEARTRYLIRQLHALGHQVTLEPARLTTSALNASGPRPDR